MAGVGSNICDHRTYVWLQSCTMFFFLNGGECFCRIWNIFAHMFVFAVVGFSKCKLLYLNEREKC